MIKYLDDRACKCGKTHSPIDIEVIIEKGAVRRVPELVKAFGAKKPFILSDVNTNNAAGRAVCRALEGAEIPLSRYTFGDKHLEPDEKAVGAAVMHFDCTCDIIVGVGSGVINDIGKILSVITGKKYIIVATAPSMDGYASASSSMTRGGLKVSLNTRSADAIVGDIDILKHAPLHMLKSGIGDMLAKYISIGEWRIAGMITGEYYCERVAELVRGAVRRCVDNAEGLLERDEKAVEAVFEGLIIGGVAMAYAGVSRPASGIEHYFSHVWDMRGVEFGTPVELHGIQCGVGTLYAARIYDKIRQIKAPDTKKALEYVGAFSFEEYKEGLRTFIGTGAEPMIAAEEKDGKYDRDKHKERLACIAENWSSILEVINSEIPSACEIEGLLDILEAPKSCSDFGIPEKELKMTFAATKDIRDKYVASRLCFDIGIIDEIKFQIGEHNEKNIC